MAVVIPVTHTARVDSFIEDLIKCFLDAESNRATHPHVVPLVMHCTSWPHAGNNKPITRRDVLSSPKLLIAKGAPREEQAVLGLMIDTHLLLIARLSGLSQEDWKGDIRSHWLQALPKLPQAVWLGRFGDNLKPSPLHLKGSQNLHPSFEALFKAFDKADPPTSTRKPSRPSSLKLHLPSAFCHLREGWQRGVD
jgi:hypothetical protein